MWTFSANLDFIFFMHGLFLTLLGATCLACSRGQGKGPAWLWLAAFGSLLGASEWVNLLALSLGDGSVFQSLRLVLEASAYLALIEFGRHGPAPDRTRTAGGWIYVLLLTLAGLGLFAGMTGLHAACRYALGFPGGLLAAWTLWQASWQDAAQPRPALRITALAFLLYALAAWLIAPTASFLPASWGNRDVFLIVAGSLVQLLLAVCAFAAMAGIWLSRAHGDASTGRAGLIERCLVPVTLAVVLSLAWFAAEWRAQIADAEMRKQMLDQATAIARTISPDEVMALWFTPEDRDNPAYQRISEQMIAYGRLIKQRSIYSLTIRNGALMFGPENIAEDDPWASPPGTIYEQPGAEDWGAFTSRDPYTIGPETDEYGIFVSGLSPVLAPRTGEVLMLVGLDVAADQWSAQIFMRRLVPILFALVLSSILIVGAIAIKWREGLPPERLKWLRHCELAMTFALGLVATLAGAFLIYESEAWQNRQVFSQLADAKTELLRARVQSVGRDLANIGGFYDANGHVTRQQFSTFVFPLIQNTLVQTYAWVPCIASADRGSMEARERHEGFHWSWVFPNDNHGERATLAGTDPHFPVYCVEPPGDSRLEPGFDLGSEPVRRAEMEEAKWSMFPVASKALSLVQDGGRSKDILVYQPVYSDPVSTPIGPSNVGGQKSLRGFALAVLNMESFLERTIFSAEKDKSILSAALLQLTPEGEATVLTAYPEAYFNGDAREELYRHLKGPDLAALRPLFAFGRAYAIALEPGPGFTTSSPFRMGLAAGLIGLIATIIGTLLVGFLRNRQASLERQVQLRTAELLEREAALMASEASLQAILRSTADGILAVSKDNRMLFANDRFADIWKVPQELVDNGDDRAMIQYVLDQLIDPESFVRKVQRLYESKEDDFDTLHFKDGRVVDRRSRPMLDGEELLGRVWSFQDVTERKRAEDDKEKLEAELRYAHKMEAIGTLTGGIAHDFNNILAAIIGYTEMALTDDSMLPPVGHYLEQVVKASHRAKDLVKQLLAFSRRTQAQERKPIELAPVINEALQLMRASLPTTIEIRQDMGCETGTVLADPTEVHQVVVNLCTNAAHAMEETGGVIEVCLRAVAIGPDVVSAQTNLQPGSYLRLTVRDTGHGIDPSILEKVFDPYFSTKGAGKGSGLGLAVVYGIVRRCEGAIAVDSKPGIGASFHVYFPKLESAVAKQDDEVEDPLPRGAERILVVDDEEVLAEMERKMLEWLGYEVSATTSSVEALEMFRTGMNGFDLVITDYTMPHMTGADLAREIMRIRPEIPVILCTGYSDKISEAKATGMGIRAFAMKPLNMREMARTVRRILDQR